MRGLACTLTWFVMLAACASLASAGEQTAPPQWRARGLSVEKTSRPAIIPVLEARSAASRGSANRLNWSTSRLPGGRARAIDSAVRTVQHEATGPEPAPEFNEPTLSDTPTADLPVVDTAPAESHPEAKSEPPAAIALEPSQPASEELPAPAAKEEPPIVEASQPTTEPATPDDLLKRDVPPADKLYPDGIPTPPGTELPTPSGDLGGIDTSPGDMGCSGYPKQCKDAIEELQKRDITTVFVGLVIEGTEGEDFPCDCRLGRDYEAPKFAGRNFSRTLFTWKATGTCHKPLYFEDVQLERYGHSWNPLIQPFISGAHFFVSVPLLPYKMGLNPKHECMYTLGYYRPGSCAPYMLEPIPLSLRAAAFEASWATAFAFWFWPPN